MARNIAEIRGRFRPIAAIAGLGSTVHYFEARPRTRLNRPLNRDKSIGSKADIIDFSLRVTTWTLFAAARFRVRGNQIPYNGPSINARGQFSWRSHGTRRSVIVLSIAPSGDMPFTEVSCRIFVVNVSPSTLNSIVELPPIYSGDFATNGRSVSSFPSTW